MTPIVLFACVHNAGRSHPVAVAAMAEEGIDIAGAQPKVLTEDAVRVSDVVETLIGELTKA